MEKVEKLLGFGGAAVRRYSYQQAASSLQAAGTRYSHQVLIPNPVAQQFFPSFSFFWGKASLETEPTNQNRMPLLFFWKSTGQAAYPRPWPHRARRSRRQMSLALSGSARNQVDLLRFINKCSEDTTQGELSKVITHQYINPISFSGDLSIMLTPD